MADRTKQGMLITRNDWLHCVEFNLGTFAIHSVFDLLVDCFLLLTDRDSDRDRERERDSVFRIRERTRWLDSMREDSNVLRLDRDRREESNVLRLDRDRTDGISLLGESKKQIGLQNPLSFGEDLLYWTDRVSSSFYRLAMSA